MAEPALARMTADEFLEWDHGRDGKHELVDGFVVTLMAPAKNAHDVVVVNVLTELRSRLRTGDCRPYTDDIAVRTNSDRVRRPDVTVDCGPRNRTALSAASPRAVFEVLSPSTRVIDATAKLDEYRDLASLAHIVIIDPDVVDVIAYTRTEGGWSPTRLSDLDATLALPGIGAELPLAAMYEDAEPAPAPPRLVD